MALLTRTLATAALVALLALPAEAHTGSAPVSAPVTVPDVVTTYAGNLVLPTVLRNDSDPEGDRLKVCALGAEKYPRIDLDKDFDDRGLLLEVGGKARPGTYSFTYYACDRTARTPGTLTLVVLAPPRITVKAVRGAHGRLRATSRAPFRVRLTYGDFTRDDAEGIVNVPRKGSVTFSTRYHRSDWIARTVDGTFLDQGTVRHVP